MSRTTFRRTACESFKAPDGVCLGINWGSYMLTLIIHTDKECISCWLSLKQVVLAAASLGPHQNWIFSMVIRAVKLQRAWWSISSLTALHYSAVAVILQSLPSISVLEQMHSEVKPVSFITFTHSAAAEIITEAEKNTEKQGQERDWTTHPFSVSIDIQGREAAWKEHK